MSRALRLLTVPLLLLVPSLDAAAQAVSELETIVRSRVCQGQMPVYDEIGGESCDAMSFATPGWFSCMQDVERQNRIIREYNDFVRRCNRGWQADSAGQPPGAPAQTTGSGGWAAVHSQGPSQRDLEARARGWASAAEMQNALSAGGWPSLDLMERAAKAFRIESAAEMERHFRTNLGMNSADGIRENLTYWIGKPELGVFTNSPGYLPMLRELNSVFGWNLPDTETILAAERAAAERNSAAQAAAPAPEATPTFTPPFQSLTRCDNHFGGPPAAPGQFICGDAGRVYACQCAGGSCQPVDTGANYCTSPGAVFN